jgi:hypothetical protein
MGAGDPRSGWVHHGQQPQARRHTAGRQAGTQLIGSDAQVSSREQDGGGRRPPVGLVSSTPAGRHARAGTQAAHSRPKGARRRMGQPAKGVCSQWRVGLNNSSPLSVFSSPPGRRAVGAFGTRGGRVQGGREGGRHSPGRAALTVAGAAAVVGVSRRRRTGARAARDRADGRGVRSACVQGGGGGVVAERRGWGSVLGRGRGMDVARWRRRRLRAAEGSDRTGLMRLLRSATKEVWNQRRSSGESLHHPLPRERARGAFRAPAAAAGAAAAAGGRAAAQRAAPRGAPWAPPRPRPARGPRGRRAAAPMGARGCRGAAGNPAQAQIARSQPTVARRTLAFGAPRASSGHPGITEGVLARGRPPAGGGARRRSGGRHGYRARGRGRSAAEP